MNRCPIKSSPLFASPRLLASSHSTFLSTHTLKHHTLPSTNPLALKRTTFTQTRTLTTTAAHRKNNNKNPSNKNKSPKLDPIWTNLFTRLAKGAALFAAVSAVLLSSVASAHAARSGGRIGGAGFGRSYSSYGGSSAFGSRSSLSSSSSMFGSSLSRSTLPSHHSTTVVPYRSSVSTNAFFFSPFGFGFGYGYPMGGGFAQLIFWAVFATIAVQVVQGVLAGGQSAGELDSGIGGSDKISVAKVQVGLLGTARDLQKDLERIAGRADTSSPRGLHFVLQETILSLMRNPNYCVYGYARSGVERSPEDAEARFNKLSLEERGKFEKETRINVGGRSTISRLDIKKDLTTPVSELLVVTILVAAEGRLKLPKVSSRQELIDALTTLGSVRADDVLAVEVLWTPEEEDDYFTQEDLARDYPLLNTL